jgi:hypothetical protein
MAAMAANLRLVQGQGDELSHLLDNLDFATVARWTERGPRFERQITRFRLRDSTRLSPAELQLVRDMFISLYLQPTSKLAETWRHRIETKWARWPYFSFGQIIQLLPDRERAAIVANGDWLEVHWQNWREPHAPVPALPWPRHGYWTPAFPSRPICL